MESTENSSSSNRSPFDDIGPENVHDNRQVSGLPSGFQLEDDDFLMSRHGLPSGAVMAVIKPTVNDPFGIAYYNELVRVLPFSSHCSSLQVMTCSTLNSR